MEEHLNSTFARIFFPSIILAALTGCRGTGALGLVKIEGAIVESEEIVENLQRFEKNPAIKGVLVVVNSSGGGVGPSQEIFEAIKSVKESGKKVVVSMSSVAASGGYYVSLPADVIVALPSTLTGSIGVILNFPVYKGLLEKVGVQVYTVKSREHKDIGSGTREPTLEDTLLLKSMIDDVYGQFLEEVVRWRGLAWDSAYAVADGRILSGRQAYQYGLVDTLGTREDAYKILTELCGLKGRPKLVEIPKKQSLLEQLLESRLRKITSPSLRYQMDLR